jgi:hypothetical protein
MAKTFNAPMINIGASPEAVKAARSAVIDILKVPYVDNKTKMEALRAFTKVCAVEGSTISNCTFTITKE